MWPALGLGRTLSLRSVLGTGNEFARPLRAGNIDEESESPDAGDNTASAKGTCVEGNFPDSS